MLKKKKLVEAQGQVILKWSLSGVYKTVSLCDMYKASTGRQSEERNEWHKSST